MQTAEMLEQNLQKKPAICHSTGKEITCQGYKSHLCPSIFYSYDSLYCLCKFQFLFLIHQFDS